MASRMAIDLGLHYEDGAEIDKPEIKTEDGPNHPLRKTRQTIEAKEKGRREWVRDLRRRVWWCVYSFDRLVSTCVGRPVSITDHAITTEFPSVLDDNYITTSGFTAQPGTDSDPSYKRVAHHYFRLRLLQSEILQVVQFRQAQQMREKVRGGSNGKTEPSLSSSSSPLHDKLSSPFMERFDSFAAWRKDIDRRLWEWKESSPETSETTVQFSVSFLELNYWQAVILLYRQNLSPPPELSNDVSTSEEITSPVSLSADDEGDDVVFLKVAEAGQKTLKLYHQLHRMHLVSYTYFATHHLIMAGIAFLYAIWYSAAVRKSLVSLFALHRLRLIFRAASAHLTLMRSSWKKANPCEGLMTSKSC